QSTEKSVITVDSELKSGSNQPREVLSRSIWNGKWKQSTEGSVIGRFGMESGSNQPREVLSRSIRNGEWKQSTERSVITVNL
ncbi:hypothetical protein DTX80_16775, partial [Bacilli bacterium]